MQVSSLPGRERGTEGCLVESPTHPLSFLLSSEGEKENQEGIHWQFNQIARQWHHNSCHKKKGWIAIHPAETALSPSTASIRVLPLPFEKQCLCAAWDQPKNFAELEKWKVHQTSSWFPRTLASLYFRHLWSWCFCSSWRCKVSVWTAAGVNRISSPWDESFAETAG